MTVNFSLPLVITLVTLVGIVFAFGKILWEKQDKAFCEKQLAVLNSIEKNLVSLSEKIEGKILNLQYQVDSLQRQIDHLNQKIDSITGLINSFERRMYEDAKDRAS